METHHALDEVALPVDFLRLELFSILDDLSRFSLMWACRYFQQFASKSAFAMPSFHDTMLLACKGGYFSYLKFWFDGKRRPVLPMECATMAALYGHKDIVAWFAERTDFPVRSPELFLHAVVNDSMDVIMFLLDHGCLVSTLAQEVAQLRCSMGNFVKIEEIVKAKGLSMFSVFSEQERSLSRIYGAKRGLLKVNMNQALAHQVDNHYHPFILQFLVREFAIFFQYDACEILARNGRWNLLKTIFEVQNLPPFSKVPKGEAWYQYRLGFQFGGGFGFNFGRGGRDAEFRTLHSAISKHLTQANTDVQTLKWFLEHDYVDFAEADLAGLLKSDANWDIIRAVFEASKALHLDRHLSSLLECDSDAMFKRVMTETNAVSAFTRFHVMALARVKRVDRLKWLLFEAKLVPITHEIAVAIFSSALKEVLSLVVPSIIPVLKLAPSDLFNPNMDGFSFGSRMVSPIYMDVVHLYIDLFEKGWATFDHTIQYHIGHELQTADDLLLLVQRGGFEWNLQMQTNLLQFHRNDILNRVFLEDSLPLGEEARNDVILNLASTNPILLLQSRFGKEWSAQDTLAAAKARRWVLVDFGLANKADDLSEETRREILVEAIKCNLLHVPEESFKSLCKFLRSYDVSVFKDPVDDSWYSRDPFNIETIFLLLNRGVNLEINKILSQMIDLALSPRGITDEGRLYYDMFTFDFEEAGYLNYVAKISAGYVTTDATMYTGRIPLDNGDCEAFKKALKDSLPFLATDVPINIVQVDDNDVSMFISTRAPKEGDYKSRLDKEREKAARLLGAKVKDDAQPKVTFGGGSVTSASLGLTDKLNSFESGSSQSDANTSFGFDVKDRKKKLTAEELELEMDAEAYRDYSDRSATKQRTQVFAEPPPIFSFPSPPTTSPSTTFAFPNVVIRPSSNSVETDPTPSTSLFFGVPLAATGAAFSFPSPSPSPSSSGTGFSFPSAPAPSSLPLEISFSTEFSFAAASPIASSTPDSGFAFSSAPVATPMAFSLPSVSTSPSAATTFSFPSTNSTSSTAPAVAFSFPDVKSESKFTFQ